MNKDLEIIKRVKNGDHSAFKLLVDEHKKNVYYLAYDLLGNREDAEDLTQDVFIRVFKSIKNFRGDSKFSTWLYRITVNSCLSLRRKNKNIKKAEDDEMESLLEKRSSEKNISAAHNPERFTESGFIKKGIEKAIEKLSPREKSVFVMRNYNELPFGEISEILKLKLGTVRSLNFRALEKLRNELAYYKNSIPTEEING